MRLAYVVSRFPVASETFVVRELNVLEDDHGVQIALLALFPPGRAFVHPDAQRWVGRVRKPGWAASLAAAGYWLRRRPLASLRTVAVVMSAYARNPRLLLRALVTVGLAFEHARTLERESIGHVHAHFATYPALTAWVCHRLTGVSYGFTAHAHDIYVSQDNLARMVREAAYVVTISDFNRRFLARFGGDVSTPVHVVHCGIDPERYLFRPRAPARGSVARALCVASLQEHKGHRVLLTALADGPGTERIELDLVGDGPLRGELEELTVRLGLSDRVRFLGEQDEPAVTRLLDAADIFVLPSIRARNGQMEGIPVALMEALASGVPTVATRLSGVPELVQDGVTGLLSEPGDARQLAQALARVLADGEGAIARARAGRQLVEREFDVRRSGAVLAALFSRVPGASLRTGSGARTGQASP